MNINNKLTNFLAGAGLSDNHKVAADISRLMREITGLVQPVLASTVQLAMTSELTVSEPIKLGM